MEERRKEAREDLGGAERRAAAEQEVRKKKEAERREKEDAERVIREEGKKKRRAEEEKKLLEDQERAAEESRARAEEERGVKEKEERARREEALLKRIQPPGKPQPPREEERKSIEQITPKKERGATNIPRIRTYKYDAAEAIKKQGESLARIALAEKEKKHEETMGAQQPPARNIALRVSIITILLFAMGGGGWLIYRLEQKGTFAGMIEKFKGGAGTIIAPTAPRVPSIIPAQEERGIKIPEERSMALATITQEMEVRMESDRIKNIFFSETVVVPAEKGGERVQKVSSVGELLSLWPHAMPLELARSIDDAFMLGVYSSPSGDNVPFLILTTNSYGQTFAGMFNWERSMSADFHNLFGAKERSDAGAPFRDIVLNGVDARASRGVNDKTALIYGFKDKKAVVITTEEETFGKIISLLP